MGLDGQFNAPCRAQPRSTPGLSTLRAPFLAERTAMRLSLCMADRILLRFSLRCQEDEMAAKGLIGVRQISRRSDPTGSRRYCAAGERTRNSFSSLAPSKPTRRKPHRNSMYLSQRSRTIEPCDVCYLEIIYRAPLRLLCLQAADNCETDSISPQLMDLYTKGALVPWVSRF